MNTEKTNITEKLVDLFWKGLSDYSSDVWFDSSSNEKEEILWWALEKLGEPVDKDFALEIFWQWAEGIEEDSFIDFDGLTESQTLKVLSSDDIKVEEKNGHFEIYKDGKLIRTCDNMKEVKDELRELETNKNKYRVTWAVIEKDDKVKYKSEEVEAASEEDAINIIKDKNAFDKKAIKLESLEGGFAEEFRLYENLWD